LLPEFRLLDGWGKRRIFVTLNDVEFEAQVRKNIHSVGILATGLSLAI
jgi:hypothetical protein